MSRSTSCVSGCCVERRGYEAGYEAKGGTGSLLSVLKSVAGAHRVTGGSFCAVARERERDVPPLRDKKAKKLSWVLVLTWCALVPHLAGTGVEWLC